MRLEEATITRTMTYYLMRHCHLAAACVCTIGGLAHALIMPSPTHDDTTKSPAGPILEKIGVAHSCCCCCLKFDHSFIDEEGGGGYVCIHTSLKLWSVSRLNPFRTALPYICGDKTV